MTDLAFDCLLQLYDARGRLLRPCGTAAFENDGPRLRFCFSLRSIGGVREAALVAPRGAAEPFHLKLFAAEPLATLEGVYLAGELTPPSAAFSPAQVVEALRRGTAIVQLETPDGPVRGIPRH